MPSHTAVLRQYLSMLTVTRWACLQRLYLLHSNVEMRHGQAFNKGSGARISACVPMHTFGHPANSRIADICNSYTTLVEDCAESLEVMPRDGIPVWPENLLLSVLTVIKLSLPVAAE